MRAVKEHSMGLRATAPLALAAVTAIGQWLPSAALAGDAQGVAEPLRNLPVNTWTPLPGATTGPRPYSAIVYVSDRGQVLTWEGAKSVLAFDAARGEWAAEAAAIEAPEREKSRLAKVYHGACWDSRRKQIVYTVPGLMAAYDPQARKGYTFYVGPELEYFYFRSPERPEPLDSAGYFDLTPQDVASGLRRETMGTLERLGIPVEYSHHEVAPSQQEIDLRYRDALTMADSAMTYRFVVKEVALKHGIHATFMPKPIFGVNGSGMHVHQSLFKGERNAFFDGRDAYHLSATARHYIAGLLRHAREITAVTSQWVNSYKRLVPGYEAPVYICWGQKNRSALVRVPRYKPGKEKATRAEMRSPDPACNPYLAFSVMLAAGLAGIEGKYELPPPTERDVYHLTPEERRELGIGELPGSLFDALQCAETSELVRDALGDHIFESFLANKRLEWDRYRTHVSQFELDAYLGVL